MGTNQYASGTGHKEVTRTKKVKCSVHSNAYEDNFWRPDYDLREVPKPICNGPARTQSTWSAHKPQEEATHTRTGPDTTNTINLLDEVDFDSVKPDCAYKSSTEGPALLGNSPDRSLEEI
jgi:hypothetical protein